MKNISKIFIAAPLSLALFAAGCAANETEKSSDSSTTESKLSGNLSAAGSSAQASAQEAWIAEFQTKNPDVTINYSPDGSGAGRKAFLAGGVDYAGTDSPLGGEEREITAQFCATDSDVLNLPVYISPIVVAYNVDGVDELKLDAETIAGIFKGDIKNWNDEKIAKQNPNAKLPAESITRVNRSDDSGTTKNFSDYLYQNVPDIWSEEPSDTFPFPGGEAAKGSSGVADAVKNGKNTIGYVDASVAKANSLNTSKIKVGEEYIAYSAEASANVVANASAAPDVPENDLTLKINRKTTNSDEYPLVLLSYILACQEYKSSDNVDLIKAYLSYIASEEGQAKAADAAGSAPLNSEQIDKVQKAIKTLK